MTTEERIQKEAGEYSAGQLVMGERATFGYKGYTAGATIEAARNKENAVAFEQEIERLKGLIQKAHYRGWLDFPDEPHLSMTVEQSWEIFKADYDL